uniref:Uncharacterized protein n=1 Tax=Arundo donax TaxID=35708 RepID=A0A0A9SV97_ARUDO
MGPAGLCMCMHKQTTTPYPAFTLCACNNPRNQNLFLLLVLLSCLPTLLLIYLKE